MDQPRPNDAAGNDAEGYPIAPLPETFRAADSPACQPESTARTSETYDLGPEVDAQAYSAGTRDWREAAAGVHRERDEFDVIDEPLPPRRIGQAQLVSAIDRRKELQQPAKIGAIEDPARFTLSSMFLLITAASVALAFGSRLPRPLFAGVSGGAALVTLLASKWLRHGSAVLNVAWYTLLMIYILTSVFAALGL